MCRRSRPRRRRTCRSSCSSISRCSCARDRRRGPRGRHRRRCLTATMILLFLGSWRSTLIVAVSIPLSILIVDHALLRALGHSLNVMTLGGLALAVGILVDDATVEIENIHRNLGMGKPLRQAILDGAQQIAVPTFVSTLRDLHRVRPGLRSSGPAEVPLHAAGAGGRLRDDGVATCSRARSCRRWCDYLLPGELDATAQERQGAGLSSAASSRGVRARLRARSAARYVARCWPGTLAHRARRARRCSRVLVARRSRSLPFVGRDFFPHGRRRPVPPARPRPAGTRLEETERLFAQVEQTIRRSHSRATRSS